MLSIASILSISVEYQANQSRDAYAERAGEAKIALHNKLFKSSLSYEGAFSGVVDCLVQENF